MILHDQRLKSVLIEFFVEFWVLFYPRWAALFDFTNVDWLMQELFPDPPDGERRQVDLLAKIGLRRPLRGFRELLALLHVEVEASDSVDEMGCRMHRYYTHARDKHGLPVLSLVQFVNKGLEGLGIGVHAEDFAFEPDDEGEAVVLDSLRFKYLYVGMPGLDAMKYLESGSALAASLGAMMHVPDDRRAWFKAEAARRVVESDENDRRKMLLADLIQTYLPLDDADEREFQRLVANEPYREVKVMATTWFEQGVEKGKDVGQRELLRNILEKRYGSLSVEQQERLAALDNQEIRRIADDIWKAQSLDELLSN